MAWYNKLDRIVVLNLDKREDRLLQITEQFEKYEVPFERVTAIEHERGAEGLRLTMVKLFEECLEKEMQNILVFEDDCEIVEPIDTFKDTMEKVMEQLPQNYIMIFLGCQVTAGFSHYVSPNILSGNKMFSTHAVIYSQRGMREILAHDMYAPIDNFYVEKIEPIGASFCTYPLLCSQRIGYSDICKNEISWKPFIDMKFQQQLAQMKSR